jgi:hypothetical protein
MWIKKYHKKGASDHRSPTPEIIEPKFHRGIVCEKNFSQAFLIFLCSKYAKRITLVIVLED